MKSLIIICLILFITSNAFGLSALYRESSGEILAIEADENSFKHLTRDGSKDRTAYFGILTDPPFTNGTAILDPAGDRRILGYAKINDSGTVRNATQVEIDGFAAAALDDKNQMEAANALNYLKTHPDFRRIMVAVFATLIEHEFNEYRTWFTNFKTEVAASTSLADFKTRMATLPAMPQRNLAQLRTQVENRINKDD